jgi:hypothetical protein
LSTPNLKKFETWKFFSWLLAVDELALSLRGIEKPRNFMGKEFLLQSDKGLETRTAE